jgi:Tol biopolymer transport system component
MGLLENPRRSEEATIFGAFPRSGTATSSIVLLRAAGGGVVILRQKGAMSHIPASAAQESGRPIRGAETGMSRSIGIEFVAALVAAAALSGGAAGQETTRASVAANGDEGDDWSGGGTASLSGDGRVVAFTSFATNLVAGDSNGTSDVFVRDLGNDATVRVSVDSSGAEANGASDSASLSSDGRFVAFTSRATNLVAGDTNGRIDVFVHDRSTGATERVSVDSSGVEADADCFDAVLSADGRFVAFDSAASNLVAGDTAGVDVFVHDRSTGATERVSVDSSGAESDGDSTLPSISGDGALVAFVSTASNLVASDLNAVADAFVHDRVSGATERVSVDSSGGEANGGTFHVALSQDGLVAGFDTTATNLDAPDDSNPFNVVVFVHDRASGATERVSVGSGGLLTSLDSTLGALSADGRIVAFASAGLLVGDDSGSFWDVFVHDRATGITSRVSVDSALAEANGSSSLAAIATDGRTVSFSSDASDLVAGDGNATGDLFVHARRWVDASWSNYGSGFPGTNGVPAFTSRAAPVLGTSVTLDLENSSGASTTAVLFIGFERNSAPSVWGGELLVAPAITSVIPLPPSTTTFSGDLPSDESLLGVTVDLQTIESDPGAASGVSFTQGLELLLGY